MSADRRDTGFSTRGLPTPRVGMPLATIEAPPDPDSE
jgi:hypothetical protein